MVILTSFFSANAYNSLMFICQFKTIDFFSFMNEPSILTFPHLKDVSSQKSIPPAQELQKHIDNTPYSRLCF